MDCKQCDRCGGITPVYSERFKRGWGVLTLAEDGPILQKDLCKECLNLAKDAIAKAMKPEAAEKEKEA